MKNIKYYIILILIMVIIVPSIVIANNDTGKVSAYIDLIQEKSNINIDTQNLLENMIKGAFSETDKYSYFQKTETYSNEQNNYITAEYVGIGITMTKHLKGVKVVSAFDYSPAAFAGLTTDDVIVSVNGEDIGDKTLAYIASKVKGPVGTYVKLGILKNGSGAVLYYDLSRQVVAMKTVKSYIIDDVGYVYISSFTNETGNEFKLALEKFKQKNIRNIILDLRNNGGGTLKGCIVTARALLSDCTIVKMDFKYSGYLDLRYITTKKDIDYNVVVLVNERSASASEIVTGALKDNDAATIIGKKTFGKSVVQVSYPILTPKVYEFYSNKYGIDDMYLLNRKLQIYGEKLSSDDYIGATKLTIGEYITPDGHRINLKGIEPDIEVDYDGKLYIEENHLPGMLWIREKYDVGMASYEVYKAKVILKKLGYDVGIVNTVYDEVFKKAVTNFQDYVGLYPYGVLDYTTQDNINNIIRAKYINSDLQLAKAFEVVKGEK